MAKIPRQSRYPRGFTPGADTGRIFHPRRRGMGPRLLNGVGTEIEVLVPWRPV
ncbi:uncharacterized protein DS421_2g37570 [Arachis hypogaea]|nr:uncharacterized protein DS421_2g37570 [Arachis hypogaea]